MNLKSVALVFLISCVINLAPVAFAAEGSSEVPPVSTSDAGPKASSDENNDPTLLQGVVSSSDYPKIEQQIAEMVNVAMTRAEDHEAIQKKREKFSSLSQRAYATGKDLAEFVTTFRGFEQSSEAADVILDEKVKLKSKGAVEYIDQAHADAIERRVVEGMMQLAMGLGMDDASQRSKIVEEGLSELGKLVGDTEAQRALRIMSDWCGRMTVPPSAFQQMPWSVLQMDKKAETILKQAIETDNTIEQITHALHRYNHRSKFMRASARVVNTTLGIASLTPTLVSPAAQLAWTVFILTQGGPEESKLLKEVYLDRRFESRWRVLNQEARLAVNSYNLAVITKNPALLTFSNYMMGRMSKRNLVLNCEKAQEQSPQ